MSLSFNSKGEAKMNQGIPPYASDIDPDSPYCEFDDGVLVYQDKQGHWLDMNQQPKPKKPRKYTPHQSTRYKNIVIGENGKAKSYDVKTGGLKDTNKELPELYNKRENCCGCGACYAVCPTRKFLENNGEGSIGQFGEKYVLSHGAIYMEEDEEGFLYPVVAEVGQLAVDFLLRDSGFDSRYHHRAVYGVLYFPILPSYPKAE